MLRRILPLMILMSAGTVPLAQAKPCRDATTGKFTKCEKPKPVQCRDAKGKFVKCAADAAAKPDQGGTEAPTKGTPGKN